MKLQEYAAKLKNRPFQADKVNPPKQAPHLPEGLKGKIILEVGCGKGLHPILFAKENPKDNILAFERTKEKYLRFQGRMEKHNLSNLFGFYDDALSWLAHNPGELKEKFDLIFFLYPNPYPKKNQRNKRFLSSPSFSLYLASLKSGGEIIMRTNEVFYKEEAIYFAREVWGLNLIHEKTLSKEDMGTTHFERKFKAEGVTCFELKWKKA